MNMSELLIQTGVAIAIVLTAVISVFGAITFAEEEWWKAGLLLGVLGIIAVIFVVLGTCLG
jgi:hypothetical protein